MIHGLYGLSLKTEIKMSRKRLLMTFFLVLLTKLKKCCEMLKIYFCGDFDNICAFHGVSYGDVMTCVPVSLPVIPRWLSSAKSGTLGV